MVISCLYVQTVTRQCFCFPNSQWDVTAHDTTIDDYSNRYVQSLTFYFHVLELDTMTLVLKPDLDMVVTY